MIIIIKLLLHSKYSYDYVRGTNLDINMYNNGFYLHLTITDILSEWNIKWSSCISKVARWTVLRRKSWRVKRPRDILKFETQPLEGVTTMIIFQEILKYGETNSLSSLSWQIWRTVIIQNTAVLSTLSIEVFRVIAHHWNRKFIFLLNILAV